MPQLKLASCMAENSEGFCQAVARYIENRIRVPTCCVTDVSWQERERLFDRGEIQVLWLCGLPYVHKRTWMGAPSSCSRCRFRAVNAIKTG